MKRWVTMSRQRRHGMPSRFHIWYHTTSRDLNVKWNDTSITRFIFFLIKITRLSFRKDSFWPWPSCLKRAKITFKHTFHSLEPQLAADVAWQSSRPQNRGKMDFPIIGHLNLYDIESLVMTSFGWPQCNLNHSCRLTPFPFLYVSHRHRQTQIDWICSIFRGVEMTCKWIVCSSPICLDGWTWNLFS